MIHRALFWVALTLAFVAIGAFFWQSRQLSGARAEATTCAQQMATQTAAIETASAAARQAVEALQVERNLRETSQKEVASLQAALDSIQRNRPRYASRPRPTDARGHRDSILRAVRQ